MFRDVKNKMQPVSTMSTGPVLASAGVRKRPVFHPELATFFRHLRAGRGWSLRGAASQAQRWKLTPLTYQALFRLERGQVKNPEPEVLKALATLYDMPYDTLAGRFIEQRYGLRLGSDLRRHATDQESEPRQGGSDVPASAERDRISELETLVANYEALIDPLQDVTSKLVKLAVAREKSRTAARRRAGRSKSDRKAG